MAKDGGAKGGREDVIQTGSMVHQKPKNPMQYQIYNGTTLLNPAVLKYPRNFSH